MEPVGEALSPICFILSLYQTLLGFHPLGVNIGLWMMNICLKIWGCKKEVMHLWEILWDFFLFYIIGYDGDQLHCGNRTIDVCGMWLLYMHMWCSCVCMV